MSQPADSASFSLGRVLFVVLPLALLAGAAVLYSKSLQSNARDSLERTIASRLLGELGSATLDGKFKDADGDLVADPPRNEAELLDPQQINFSYVASSDEEDEQATWQEALAALESRLGRKVNLVSFADPAEQLRAFQKGELHITAFATGEVEKAVNEAGFVPALCFANEAGEFSYSMKIIVPAASEVKNLEDVRGKRMTFVRPRSNSGCTAALVLLMKERHLQPERDYDWGWSFGHESSISGIAEGKFSVAAVASDIVDRMIASGAVAADAIRVIHESEPYPPGVIGYAHNLTPELRQAVQQALLELDWSGSGLEKRYGPSGSARFASVDYKNDWAAVRAISKTGRELFAKLDRAP